MAELVHLGWDRPLLVSASEWLADRYSTGELGGGIDLSRVLVVTPGRRFGRQLLAELVEIGEKGGRWVSTGRLITPGELCGYLLRDQPEGQASAITRGLVWGSALRELERGEFELILRRRPEDDAAGEWMKLGQLFDATVGELARELILPGQVPELCPKLRQFGDDRKWEVIEKVRGRYESLLAGCGLKDGHLSHLAALQSDPPREGPSKSSPTDLEIVIVGVAELDRATRLAIEKDGRVVRSLVFAPPSVGNRIDELGCVAGDGGEYRVPLAADSIEFGSDYADSARRAIGRIAAWTSQPGKVRASDVSVCAPEAGMIRELVVAAEGVPGLSFHNAAGEPVGKRSVLKLLSRLAEYLREATVESLAKLVKQPIAERWVESALRASGRYELMWLRRLDELAVQNPAANPDETGGYAAQIGERAQEIVGPMRTTATLAEHLQSVEGALERLLREAEIEESEAEALSLLATAMAELKEASEIAGRMTGWRAIELLLTAVQSATTAAETRRGEVEVLGWLEAAVDRAPFLVIAGLNDGSVPGEKSQESLLPEGVRRTLGMPTADLRAARDAYMLEGMLRSRKRDGEVWTIVSGQDSEGNPLKPSRFVFACEENEAVARIMRWTAEATEPARFRASGIAPEVAENSDDSAFPLAPQHAMPPPSNIRATAFADYLSSPYVFFLKHVAGLTEVQEASGEADPLSIGNILHEVLRGFKDSDEANETRPEVIERWALAALESNIERLRVQKLATVRQIQIEVAKRRLATFASVQADHAAKGWRIWATEWVPPSEVVLRGSRGSVRISGRIDRVDRRDNEWLILDYKTGDRGDKPEKTHYKQKEWVNLQLPLYAMILRESGVIAAEAQVGFFLLPKKTEEGRIAIADWSTTDFEEAEARAKLVVDAVLRGEFELGDNPREGGAFARLCGVTLIDVPDEEDGQ